MTVIINGCGTHFVSIKAEEQCQITSSLKFPWVSIDTMRDFYLVTSPSIFASGLRVKYQDILYYAIKIIEIYS